MQEHFQRQHASKNTQEQVTFEEKKDKRKRYTKDTGEYIDFEEVK